ncbi:hypothetical protein OE88DRAFT_1631560 [Heliocybe sulcata]|uniref:Uncharacterized protein n=1 Tax=Heliocybe sulcata TaxID=5364 RepID=A0A5C3MZI9_9AGAM|nr:hypothetical protein OE88DRAFT_1631560 [Heliocybe sulcata]
MYLLPSNDSVFPIAASPNALANVSLLPPPSSDTCDNIDNCRTLYNIVWSCIVTIFACTWVAIHPNIPPQDAHWAHKLGRRVVTTVYAIIAPECVVLWAAKQWFTSRRLAEKYKRKHGWTQTHGFFTIMGGFLPLLSTPVHRDTGVHAAPSLDISTLPFPDITSREIQDRSKGDWFSKGAAILQTSWFLVQCIARRIQRLTLTELELATCAFAVLNAVVYGLWWNKPKAVDCLYAIRRTIRSLSIDLTGSDARASRDPQASSPGRLEKRRGTLRKLSWSNPKKIIVATVDRTWRFACCWDEHDDWYTHVNPYYSGHGGDEGRALTLIAFASSSAFGAVHCIGWAFEFPSHTQQILWRSCSLAITCLPLLTVSILVVSKGIRPSRPRWLRHVLSGLIMCIIVAELPIYVAARITLLTIAFLSLSSLPADAYRTVSWTNYIPHI